RPGVDKFIDHLKYVADLVGIDHVGLGMDYYHGQAEYDTHGAMLELYKSHIAKGRWSASSYPPPPYYWPEKIETPDRLANLPEAMAARGFSAEDIVKVLGMNWTRLLSKVWGD